MNTFLKALAAIGNTNHIETKNLYLRPGFPQKWHENEF